MVLLLLMNFDSSYLILMDWGNILINNYLAVLHIVLRSHFITCLSDKSYIVH